MFHVSTLLPFKEGDSQQLERKRHIGNDILVIVFKEGNQPFDPRIINSNFNHIFVVVEKVKSDTNESKYRLAIVTKPLVPSSTPILKNPAIYTKNALFRDFLFTKCINLERVALNSQAFHFIFGRFCYVSAESIEAMPCTKLIAICPSPSLSRPAHFPQTNIRYQSRGREGIDISPTI